MWRMGLLRFYGRTTGRTILSKISDHNCSPLPLTKMSQSSNSFRVKTRKISFISHFQWRHTSNLLSLWASLKIFNPLLSMTPGHISGIKIFSFLLKHTGPRLITWNCLRILGGFGLHVVSWSTNSFFKCSFSTVSTSAMLVKWNLHLPSYECVLCGEALLETRDHLFFHCPFAKAFWNYLCPGFSPKQNVRTNVSLLKT